MVHFAHMSDVHIGAWRDPKLKDLTVQAFTKAIELCLQKKVDFVLIAGDLFNTALPGIDHLRATVIQLKRLKEAQIPVYCIPGSHDFSPSGKTMLDVLEEAGLLINVARGEITDNKISLKFTTDPKTKSKITGMLGKKGGLEKHYFDDLNLAALEVEPGFKIFMFHTALTELKPKEMEQMESNPISLLPKGFDYYAGGHVHIVKNLSLEGYRNVVYPGPMFPASFSEMEKLERGGFYFFEDSFAQYQPVQVKNVVKIYIDAHRKSVVEVEQILREKVEKQEFTDSIVLIRLEGRLRTGKPFDINFRDLFNSIYQKGAFFVMRNTSKLISEEFEEVKIDLATADDLEDALIKEHLGQIKISFKDKEEQFIKDLMKVLSMEKDEGEKKYEYEAKLKKMVDEVLGV
ncbi:MAG TPA: exonuclease SbcCD subunit D [Candidatus Nanoarchaeia archaeon]|nr:exonuclease SbcCD subunit D [Candidatus Nanoarchaeia archaeon]